MEEVVVQILEAVALGEADPQVKRHIILLAATAALAS
jgi:hypothetical protein